MIKILTKEQLAKTIDLTLLSPTATYKNAQGLCLAARKYHFAAVVINPCYISICKKMLKDSDVKICSVVAYPLGAATVESKVFESKDCIKKGADELDIVINLGMLKSGNFEYVEKEIQIIVNVIRREQMAEYNKHINIKIVIENGSLTKDEVIKTADIIEESGVDFIKTSSGFGVRGVELDDVRLIREVVTRDIGVKASGGIRTFKDAQALIDAGATRLGTSSGIRIMDEYSEIFDK